MKPEAPDELACAGGRTSRSATSCTPRLRTLGLFSALLGHGTPRQFAQAVRAFFAIFFCALMLSSAHRTALVLWGTVRDLVAARGRSASTARFRYIRLLRHILQRAASIDASPVESER